MLVTEIETEIDLSSNQIKIQLQLYIRLYTVNNTLRHAQFNRKI